MDEVDVEIGTITSLSQQEGEAAGEEESTIPLHHTGSQSGLAAIATLAFQPSSDDQVSGCEQTRGSSCGLLDLCMCTCACTRVRVFVCLGAWKIGGGGGLDGGKKKPGRQSLNLHHLSSHCCSSPPPLFPLPLHTACLQIALAVGDELEGVSMWADDMLMVSRSWALWPEPHPREILCPTLTHFCKPFLFHLAGYKHAHGQARHLPPAVGAVCIGWRSSRG